MTYLKSNFCFLTEAITNLEKSSLSLDEDLNLFYVKIAGRSYLNLMELYNLIFNVISLQLSL